MADYGTPLSSPLHPRNWYKRQEEKAMTTTDVHPNYEAAWAEIDTLRSRVKVLEAAIAHKDAELMEIQRQIDQRPRGYHARVLEIAWEAMVFGRAAPSAPLTEEDTDG